MSETQTDWQVFREAEQYAKDAAREYVAEHGDSDDALTDYAHETADGSAFVIYYWRIMALWNASQDVRDYEEEAEAGGFFDDNPDIIRRMTICAYLWLCRAIEEAVLEVRAEQENADDAENTAA